VADPAVKAIGDGEVESGVKPSALDEDDFALLGLELEACVSG
jgi:hypothetical protein